MKRFASVIIASAILICGGAALADDAKVTQAARGIAAQVEVDYQPHLRARAEPSRNSPITVRVHGEQGSNHQTIEFIGTVAGSFDLRDYLEREDGQPLSVLAAIPITVISQLPADHGVDLYGSGASWLNWRAHYRELMWAAVALWAVVPIVVLIVRALRRRRVDEAPTPVAPPPTVEELLRSALEVARSRPLSIDESGQLELLVFRYFGERFGIERDPSIPIATMLRDLRAHPESRDLVMAIERWLHARGGTESGREHAAAALEELRRTRLAPRIASPVEVSA